MQLDLDTATTDVHDRLATLVPQLVTIDTVDEMEEALRKPMRVPAAYTMWPKAPSEGLLTPQSRKQIKFLELTILIVTQSWRTAGDATTGALGNYRIQKLIDAAIQGWRPSWALKKFIYVNYEFFARVGPRTAYELTYRTAAEDDFGG